MKNILYALSFFLMSLFSIYIYSIPLLSILGMLLMFFTAVLYRDVKGNGDFKVFGFFLFLYVLSILGFLFFDTAADYKRLFGFSLILFFSFFVSFIRNKFDLKYVLSFFLIVHIVFFYVQFIVYFVFFTYLDYLSLFGLESRGFGGNFQLPFLGKFMRTSGLYSEPGTYACFIAPAIALFHEYVESKKDCFIFYSALLTLILSFSAFGFMFFLIIFVFLVRSFVYRMLFGVTIFLISVPYIYWKFFLRKEQLGRDTVLDFRKEFIESALENFTTFQGLFFGHGGFSVEGFEFLYGGADNDSGLLFYVLYNFGAIAFFMLLFVFVFLALKNSRQSFVTVIIVILSKISFFSLMLPMYFYIAVSWKNKKQIKLKFKNK